MESKVTMTQESLGEFADELYKSIEEENKPKTLLDSVAKLKEESTEGEYENLIKMMFDKLDRKGQRSLIPKSKKFSGQVSKALFKSK